MLKKFKVDDYSLFDIFPDFFKYVNFDKNGEDYDASAVLLNTIGEAAVEQRQTDAVGKWMPISISILALISSTRAEILWLIQAISKLLK